MKLANDVHQAIQAAVIDGREVRLTGQLDRKLYVAVDKALQAAGGRWNRKAGAHVFDSDALPVIAAMLDEGEIATAQETGFFPSPPPVVSRLLQLAAVEPGMTALEPSAGTGAVVDALAVAGAVVDCIEVDPRLVEKLTVTVHDVTRSNVEGVAYQYRMEEGHVVWTEEQEGLLSAGIEAVQKALRWR